MNRFVPLNYADFKRFAANLKRGLGVRHFEALTLLSKASGFKDFHAITASFRSDESVFKPCALQYAGEMGFEIWREQLAALTGAESVAGLEPALRCWYQRVFEVGGKLASWSEYQFTPVTAKRLDTSLVEATSEEVRDDLELLPVPTQAPAVVVTYRRRRQLIESDPVTSEA